MFRKACLLFLLAYMSFPCYAQPERGSQHFFQLNAFLGYDYDGYIRLDWLEVNLEANGKSHIITFHYSPEPGGNAPTHQFPLNEINMGQPGSIEIISVRYKAHENDAVINLPLGDVAECHIQIKSKDSYPNSTISEVYVDANRCGSLSVYPYLEQK
jgi:hypothetical protein